MGSCVSAGVRWWCNGVQLHTYTTTDFHRLSMVVVITTPIGMDFLSVKKSLRIRQAGRLIDVVGPWVRTFNSRLDKESSGAASAADSSGLHCNVIHPPHHHTTPPTRTFQPLWPPT